jgi:hypothetical protein
MATQEEQHLLTSLNNADIAVNDTVQVLLEFRKNLFSGEYRKNFLNSKNKFDTDLRTLGEVFANSDDHIIDAIDFARNNDIMPAFIDNIHNLNDNMAESYDRVIATSQGRAPLEHRAQISARLDETINISKKLRKSISELSDTLKERLPANNRNGGSRKRRTHHKRTHRKRTQRKHRTHRK